MRATVTGAVWGLVLGGAGVGAASLLTEVPQTPASERPASETPISETPVSETPVSEPPAADAIEAAADTAPAQAVPESTAASAMPEDVVSNPATPEPPVIPATPAAAEPETAASPTTPPPATDQTAQVAAPQPDTEAQPAAPASQGADAVEDLADPAVSAVADNVDVDGGASPADVAVASPDEPAAPDATQTITADDFLAAMEGDLDGDQATQPALDAAAQPPGGVVPDDAATLQAPTAAPAPASVADSPSQPAAVSPFAAAQADIANAMQPQDTGPSADFSGAGGFSAGIEGAGQASIQTEGAAAMQPEFGANDSPGGLTPPVDPLLDPSAALADPNTSAQPDPDAASADAGDAADDIAGAGADGSNETTADDGTGEDSDLANLPPLQRFAATFENPQDLAVVSIVLVDDGTRANAADMLAELPVPVTVILDPLQADVGERMDAYRAAGLEVGLQIVLPAGARAQDVEVAFGAAFGLVPEAVVLLSNGNDLLQTDRSATGQMLDILAQEGLGLVTVERGLSNVQRQATAAGVPAVAVMRNVDGADSGAIGRALDRAAFRARQSSGTVVLGSISAAMMNAIDDWGRDTARDDFIVAPVSAILAPDEEDAPSEDIIADENTASPDDTSAIATETPVAVTE